MKKKIAIIFLTYNSQRIIGKSILAAKKISENIIIIDDYSTDKTKQICKNLNCRIYERKFKNYSDQRNWSIKKFNKFKWQLHLDADEVLDTEAHRSIIKVLNEPLDHKKTFLLKRKNYFLGSKLNYSGLNPWHLRLFQSGYAKCENRAYDQHFISRSSMFKLKGYMLDFDDISLKKWKIKHIKWAKMEARDHEEKKIKNNFLLKKDPRFKSREAKKLYYYFPPFLRAILYFLYRYFIKLGFLDGKIGFLFCFYQCLWFRFLVDFNIFKLKEIEK